MYAETHAPRPRTEELRANKPFLTPKTFGRLIGGVGIGFALLCVALWVFGYDMLAPLLCAILIILSGFVGWHVQGAYE